MKMADEDDKLVNADSSSNNSVDGNANNDDRDDADVVVRASTHSAPLARAVAINRDRRHDDIVDDSDGDDDHDDDDDDDDLSDASNENHDQERAILYPDRIGKLRVIFFLSHRTS